MVPIKCKNYGTHFRRRDKGRFAIDCNAGGRLKSVQDVRQVKAKIYRLEIAVRHYSDATNVISADAAKQAALAEIELIEAYLLLRILLQ